MRIALVSLLCHSTVILETVRKAQCKESAQKGKESAPRGKESAPQGKESAPRGKESAPKM